MERSNRSRNHPEGRSRGRRPRTTQQPAQNPQFRQNYEPSAPPIETPPNPYGVPPPPYSEVDPYPQARPQYERATEFIRDTMDRTNNYWNALGKIPIFGNTEGVAEYVGSWIEPSASPEEPQAVAAEQSTGFIKGWWNKATQAVVDKATEARNWARSETAKGMLGWLQGIEDYSNKLTRKKLYYIFLLGVVTIGTLSLSVFLLGALTFMYCAILNYANGPLTKLFGLLDIGTYLPLKIVGGLFVASFILSWIVYVVVCVVMVVYLLCTVLVLGRLKSSFSAKFTILALFITIGAVFVYLYSYIVYILADIIYSTAFGGFLMFFLSLFYIYFSWILIKYLFFTIKEYIAGFVLIRNENGKLVRAYKPRNIFTWSLLGLSLTTILIMSMAAFGVTIVTTNLGVDLLTFLLGFTQVAGFTVLGQTEIASFITVLTIAAIAILKHINEIPFIKTLISSLSKTATKMQNLANKATPIVQTHVLKT
ncbi:hypothetical protein NEHOM01_0219 [Nematocida homosporus]|uniref:uncharacterized protein n=1 Tax=Nematocida homosporus TaxID=1912981 RepID=UPI00221F1C9A|nr:uncharacterized protein NEHOM01_0219 [Nematocida homosporus]KAI5184544.1 hypothetical protein NEHOM01_0219 [Nematocida homosporus]